MRRETLPQIALGLLVVLAIIGGLLSVGGPGQGRLERRDADRWNDLIHLGQLAFCLGRLANGTLPDTLTADPRCGEARLTDPHTGAPYVYERLSDNAYRVCATFEGRDRLQTYGRDDFNPETGCLTLSYRP